MTGRATAEIRNLKPLKLAVIKDYESVCDAFALIAKTIDSASFRRLKYLQLPSKFKLPIPSETQGQLVGAEKV